MRTSTRVILGCYSLLAALACLQVPWTVSGLGAQDFPPREVFMGFGWFWHGPSLKSKSPFDVVYETRKHWGAVQVSSLDDERMRGLSKESQMLSIADRAYVISWLKVKENFDRTFPDKQKLTAKTARPVGTRMGNRTDPTSSETLRAN